MQLLCGAVEGYYLILVQRRPNDFQRYSPRDSQGRAWYPCGGAQQG